MDDTDYISPVQIGRGPPRWLINWTPSPHPWQLAASALHIIHAPPGCDQGALVGHLIDDLPETRCWYWGKPASPVAGGDVFYDNSTLLAAFDQISAEERGYLCLTIARHDSVRFPWQSLIERAASRDSPITLLAFCRQIPADVLHWMTNGSARQWVNVISADLLAYSNADLERLAESMGTTHPKSLAACVHSVSKGWPWGSKRLLWQFRDRRFDYAEATALTLAACKQIGALPSDEELDLAALLQFAGPMPETVFHESGPLSEYLGPCVTGLEGGWLLRTNDGSAAVTTTAFIAPLVTGREIVSRYYSSLYGVAWWLEKSGYQARALNLFLALECWAEAEQVLLEIAEQYIAILDVAPVIEWLDRLDAGMPVEHPLLLVCFIRCGVYEGSEIKVTRYFARLIQQLDAKGADHFRDMLGEHRWRRLMAEVQLYALVTGLGSDNPLIMDMSRSTGNGTSPAVLMQEAYQYVLDGRLADLLPVLCAGLKQTHQQGLWPYHTVFSILNFWALMLSGRRTMAMSFLGETRRLLSENQVSFTGAYEWLDLLELLAARLAGQLDYCRDRVSQLIEDRRYFSDNLKCHVLLSLQCEMAISRHDLTEAETVLDDLLLRRKSAAGRSYWLPSALIMGRAISLLRASHPDHEPRASDSEKAGNEIQAQTGILWSLKMDLHAGVLEGVEPRLQALRERCTSQGQSLRLLETRLLLAVYLLRTGQQREALRKFSDVADKLISGQMTGVLLDPFLLWLPFMDQRLAPEQKQVLERLVSQIPGNARRQSSPPAKLTTREHQVLSLLVKGRSNPVIADELFVSVTTVRTHLQKVYGKLGVSNRAAATARAIEQGIV